MSALTLYIGSKNLSSWSLRPWLFLRHHQITFRERLIELDRPDTRERILAQSPSGRVPALSHDALRICESLAICEYAAERYELPHAWPADLAARALARSFALEMHSGFAALRRELPFNATRDPAPATMGDDTQADIRRICAIWREAREQHAEQGPWLFGEFGIVDAMFAPVAVRFEVYDVKLDKLERTYVRTVLAHKAVQQWIEAAAMEEPLAAPAEPSEPQARTATPSSPETGEVPDLPKGPATARASVKPVAAPAPQEMPRVRSVILPSD
ncbi:MAG: glutathione S-transferase N-terminal domain-containing protein [Pseudomonadota bacterium]|nr:glutathione S-transferase N-terminal domain-containing protein [Pseudomonadota bacterium]